MSDPVTPRLARQALPSMGFSRQTWVLIPALTLTNLEQGMTLEQVSVERGPSVGTTESATWGVNKWEDLGKAQGSGPGTWWVCSNP